eukprot:scpid34895/ scgid8780/ 
MKVSLIFAVLSLALCVIDAGARPMNPKLARLLNRVNKVRSSTCKTENDCNPRQCCVRQVTVGDEGEVTFSKKGKCKPIKQLTDTTKFTLSILKLAGEAEPSDALTNAAAGPPPGDKLLICPANTLEQSRERRAAKKGKKAKKAAKKAAKMAARRGMGSVDAMAVLTDVLAPDVAIATTVAEELTTAPTDSTNTDATAQVPDFGGAVAQ